MGTLNLELSNIVEIYGCVVLVLLVFLSISWRLKKNQPKQKTNWYVIAQSVQLELFCALCLFSLKDGFDFNYIKEWWVFHFESWMSLKNFRNCSPTQFFRPDIEFLLPCPFQNAKICKVVCNNISIFFGGVVFGKIIDYCYKNTFTIETILHFFHFLRVGFAGDPHGSHSALSQDFQAAEQNNRRKHWFGFWTRDI